jgi:hypothetical protein
MEILEIILGHFLRSKYKSMFLVSLFMDYLEVVRHAGS